MTFNDRSSQIRNEEMNRAHERSASSHRLQGEPAALRMSGCPLYTQACGVLRAALEQIAIICTKTMHFCKVDDHW